MVHRTGSDKIVRIEKDGDLERFLESLSKKKEQDKGGESPSFIVSAVSLEPQGLSVTPKTHTDAISLIIPIIRAEEKPLKDKAKVSSNTCETCKQNLTQELQQLMSKQELFIQNITGAASGELTDKTQTNIVPHLKKLATMTKDFRRERNVVMDHLQHHVRAQLNQLAIEQKTLTEEIESKVKLVIEQVKQKQEALKQRHCAEFKRKYGSADECLRKLQELLERCAKVWKELLETVNRFISTSQDNIEGAKILRGIQLANAAFSIVAGEVKQYNESKEKDCDSQWMFPIAVLRRTQRLETAFAPIVAFLAVGEGQVDDVETLKSKYTSTKSKIDKFNNEMRDVERKRMKPSGKKVISGSSVKDIVSKETKETNEDLNAKKMRLDEGLEVLESDRRKIVHQILVYKLSQYGETLSRCRDGLVALMGELKSSTTGLREDYSKYIAAKSLQSSHGHEWLQALRRTMVRRIQFMREAVCDNVKRDLEEANSKLESSPHLSQMRVHVAQMKGFVMVGNPVVQTLAGQIMPSREQDSHSFHKILIELSNFVRTCEMIEQLENQWLSNSWSRIYLDVCSTHSF